jgi:hypothetical protein
LNLSTEKLRKGPNLGGVFCGGCGIRVNISRWDDLVSG